MFMLFLCRILSVYFKLFSDALLALLFHFCSSVLFIFNLKKIYKFEILKDFEKQIEMIPIKNVLNY